jgi:hypothetical protein
MCLTIIMILAYSELKVIGVSFFKDEGGWL